MAVDGKKLEAFANEGEEAPEGNYEEGGGEESGEEGQPEEGNDDRFVALIPLLEEFSDDIQVSIDEMDPEFLDDTESELSPEAEEILTSGLGELDNRLMKEMRKSLNGGISMDEAMELADHLESEGIIDDGGRFGAWLFRVAQFVE